MAERKGFEPSVACATHAFQACAFDHSATSLSKILVVDFGLLTVGSKSKTHDIFGKWPGDRDSNPGRCYPQRFSRPPLSTTQPSPEQCRLWRRYPELNTEITALRGCCLDTWLYRQTTLEATPGFEPGIRALQARALPLGYVAFLKLVPGAGLEPARTDVRGILSPLRLPIPPSGQKIVNGLRSETVRNRYGRFFAKPLCNRSGRTPLNSFHLNIGLRKRKNFKNMERETGVEPATPTLARSCSTTELLPHIFGIGIIAQIFRYVKSRSSKKPAGLRRSPALKSFFDIIDANFKYGNVI